MKNQTPAIETFAHDGTNWMYANGLRAVQRPDGLWHVQVNSSLHTIRWNATTELAREILLEG